MKLSCFAGLAFCALSLAAFAGTDTPQQAPAASGVQQELINAQKAFLDALERGDAAYVKNAVADDFMGIETNGDSAGKRELVQAAQPHKPANSQTAESKPFLYDFKVVQLDSDCGVVTYNSVEHGAPIDRYQHQSFTWVKDAGQWKLKFQQATVNLWSAHDLD
jgi:hypothetical protein